MEKNKIIEYLNSQYNYGTEGNKSFISEIRRANYIYDLENANNKELVINATLQNFIEDSCKEGFHKKEFKDFRITDSELKKIQRKYNIDSLLEDSDEFDFESQLYTDEQLKKLKELRGDNNIKLPNLITMHDYYSSFKPGEKVYFNNEPGIVTYCHKPNSDGELQFTIKVRHKETKLVNPFKTTFTYGYPKMSLYVSKRSITNYEGVEVPEKVKSLSTKELLNYLRWINVSNWDNVPDYMDELHVRAELSTREHVPNRIERKKERAIAKIHGGSKSKSR